jgi:hypothetical protein
MDMIFILLDMYNNQALLSKTKYNTSVTSAFTFSMFQLPRQHMDNNTTMKKAASVLRTTTKISCWIFVYQIIHFRMLKFYI